MSSPSLAAMSERLVRHYGDNITVILRKRSSLRAGGSQVTSLTIVGDHLAGADSILATRPKLQGTLPAGAVINGVYTLQSPATASLPPQDRITLLISPALTAPLEDGEIIIITSPHADHTYQAMRSAIGIDEIQDSEGVSRRLNLIGTVAPDPGDLVIDNITGAARGEVVRRVDLIQPGSTVLRWRVTVGDAG